MQGSFPSRFRRVLITLLTLPFLPLAISGCGESADTSTSAPVEQTEQAKAANNAMQDFMKTKDASKTKKK